MNDLLISFLIPSATSGVTALITWTFARKKLNQETKATELDNVEQATKIWRELAEDLKSQVDELKAEMSGLKDEVHKYRMENKDLKRIVNNNA